MTGFPIGWEIKRLRDCLEKLKSGKLAERGWSPQCLNHPVKSDGSWGVLKTTSVQMGEYQPEYNKELPKSLEPKIGLEVNPGDFLVTTTGPRNRCGIVCHVRTSPKKLIFSGKILRFRANEDVILSGYLMFLLMSPEYQKTFDRLKVGTSDSSVSIGNSQVLDLEIPVPPLNEQSKIMELLEDYLSRLDAALADVMKAKLKAAQFRKSILQETFMGNLGNDGTNLMSELPPGWEINQLKDLCEPGKQAIVDGPFGSNLKRSDYVDSGIPVLKIQNIKENMITLKKMDYVKPEKYHELARHSFTEGDIVMTKLGAPLGVSAIVNGIANGLIVADLVRIRPSKISTKLLCYQLNSPRIQKYINDQQKGTTRPRVNLAMIRELPIFTPPIDEQRKIVEVLEGHLSRLEASVALADAMEKHSTALKRSLLQAAFTGQLTNEVAIV